MAGVIQVTQGGPKTFTPATTKTITGGQVVDLTDAGRIQPAAAGSVRFAGVALTDGIAPEDQVTTPVLDGQGRPVLTAVPVPTHVAVAYSGTEVKVTAAAAVKPGQRVKCAANGQVTPYVTGTDTDPTLIVGVCTDPNGIAATKAGLIRVN